jgi:serine/threonine-protein kinase
MGSVCRFCGASNEEKRSTCSSCQRPLAADPGQAVGQAVGNHQVVRLVGEGPIGAVYEALHTPSGEKVRLKLIDSELLSADSSLAEAAGQLVVGSTGLHDALPELVEVSLERPPVRFVSVKWVEGMTLRQLLASGPLTPEQACRIGAGMLAALDALHGAGLAHRDLKPENVLVAPAGGPIEIYLLDVGPSLISAKASVGASFRSPEQARGADTTGPATDLYSCGALLYEALSGRRPFEASDFDVLMSQISLRRPPPLGQLCPHLPPALVEAITRAMAPTPGERFRSAAEMRAALEEAVPAAVPPPQPVAAEQPAQPPPQPAPAGGSMLSRPDLPPPPRPAVVESDVFPFDVEVEAPTIRRPGVSEAEAEDLQPQSERPSRAGRVVGLIVVVVAFVVGGALLYAMLHLSQQTEATVTEPTPTTPPTPPPPDPDADMVRIRLSGLPTGAAWFDNDKRLSANPFRVRKGRAVHTIRVEAPGYEPYETRLSFGGDQEIQITMTPLPDAGTAEPFRFKAYTSGPGANVRVPRKAAPRSTITPIKQPEPGIDSLRDHSVSTPGRTAPPTPAPTPAPQPLVQ